MLVDDRPRTFAQREGPPVVAKAGPRGEQLVGPCLGQVGRVSASGRRTAARRARRVRCRSAATSPRRRAPATGPRPRGSGAAGVAPGATEKAAVQAPPADGFIWPRIAAGIAASPGRVGNLGSREAEVLCGSGRHSGSTGRTGRTCATPVLAAERAGWDSLWIDDHLLADEGDPADPKMEGWATLSALAVLTEHVRARPARRRQHVPQPGADREARHDRRPPVRRPRRPRPRRRLVRARARRLRHRLRRGLRRAARPARRGGRARSAGCSTASASPTTGRFYSMHDALCAPLPVQPRLPILIGGSGPTKTLRTTARYADLWNGYGPPEKIAATSEILRRAVRRGRPAVRRDRADRHGRCRRPRRRRAAASRLD